jgi:hypothetical protein
VGYAGSALGLVNGATYTVINFLRAANAKAQNGTLFATNHTYRSRVSEVATSINEDGNRG